MPTFRHGKSAYLALVYGGSTYALSTGFDDSSLARAVATAEVTAYGNSDQVFLAGLKSGSFQAKGSFDKTIEGNIAGALGASTNPVIKYGPSGNSTGRRKYQFSCVLTGLNVASPVGDKVSVDFTATISGAVTSTTF